MVRYPPDHVVLPFARRFGFAADAHAQSHSRADWVVLVGVGTFFAQATATGFVGRAATADRGAASGIYLACYFAGGLFGSAVLGQVFDKFGWHASVAGIALSLLVAVALTFWLILEAEHMQQSRKDPSPS